MKTEQQLESFKDIDLDNLQDLVKEPEPTKESEPVMPDAEPMGTDEPITEPEPTKVEEPVTEPEPEPTVEEDLDPEEVLRRALFETDNDIEAAKKQAEADGNQDLVNQLNELQKNLEEERIARQKLEQSNRIKDEEMGKLAEQNTLLETENLQKKRIYGAIDDDQDLQAAVVYGIQAKNKPEEYKQKFVDSLKSLLRREGIDIDALQQKAIVSEKAAITEGGQQVPVGVSGNKPTGGVMDMFETMD